MTVLSDHSTTVWHTLPLHLGTSFKHGGTKPMSSEELSDSDPESLPPTSFAKQHISHKSHQESVLKFSGRQHDPDRWDMFDVHMQLRR